MRALSALSTCLLTAVTAVSPASAQAPGTWTGLYVGANAGFSWSSADQSATPGGAWIGDPDWPAISGQLNRSLDLGGFIGGGQAGYNLQSGIVVLGAEVDFNWLDASRSFGTPRFAGAAGGTWDASGSAAVSWLATVRARLGLTAGNALYYVTGGLAIAETRFSQRVGFRNVPPPPPEEEVPALPLTGPAGGANAGEGSGIRVGFALGGGLEFKLDRSWSVKGEYLFVGLGSDGAVTSFFTSPVNGFVYSINHQSRIEALNIVRVGLNYKF